MSQSSQSSSSQSVEQPVARRRAVQPSQRREARMARPIAQTDQPRADYGPYKQIQPEMTLAEVRAILGGPGQYYELNTSPAEMAGTDAASADSVSADNVSADSVSQGYFEARTVSQSYVSESHDSEVLFWRWTHPSQAYNIHLRLRKAEAGRDELVVQAKWLTYNPPGPNTVADALGQD